MMDNIINVIYIIKGSTNKEKILESVKCMLAEKIDFEIKFLNEKYEHMFDDIIVYKNRNTIEDVDIIADVVDKFNKM